MSVHIRIVGDWTGKLWGLMNPDGEVGIVQEDLVSAPNGDAILMIDGPFGAASEEVSVINIIFNCQGFQVRKYRSLCSWYWSYSLCFNS